LNDLNKLKSFLIKRYKLDYIPGIDNLTKEINKTYEKLNILEKARVIIESKEIDRLRKLNPVTQQQINQQEHIYKVNEENIAQMVYSLKRKLMGEPKHLLELYDINELNNKTTTIYSGKPQKVISTEVYTRIKNHLTNDIRKTKQNFEIIEAKETENAINIIAKEINVKIEITSIKKAIKELTSKWIKTWNGENKTDVYGENIFEKLLKVSGPFDFYTNYIYRKYYELVKQFTPPQAEIHTKPRTLFNGRLYDVEYLDKDWGTGQPLMSYKKEYEKNPRTQMYEVVTKVTVRKGRFPFIKIILRTEQEGKTREVWQEIPPGQVRYQIMSFGRKKNKVINKW